MILWPARGLFPVPVTVSAVVPGDELYVLPVQVRILVVCIVVVLLGWGYDTEQIETVLLLLGLVPLVLPGTRG